MERSAAHHDRVMSIHRRLGSRAPLMGLVLVLVGLLANPMAAAAGGWTGLGRVTDLPTSRLDSMHQLGASKGVVHLVHPRVGPRLTDDRVLYQRSTSDGRKWSAPKVLFKATKARRTVVPNLALAARNSIVAVAFRVSGPAGHALFVRTSRNGGRSFGPRVQIFSTKKASGIGVPAITVGKDLIAVAWTNRANGRVNVRVSRDRGQSFSGARTLARTRHSIECDSRLTDGLVGLASSGSTVHLAWSHAPTRQCAASAIRVRTSTDAGRTWGPVRSITTRASFGWPELDARGKTVMAVVQGTGGELILARSAHNGRKWRVQLSKPPSGRSYSAADVVLGPRGMAWISYVNERIENDQLASTRVITRRSSNGGASFGKSIPVTRDQPLLRQAANIALPGRRPVLVVQGGALDGTPRHIYSSRYR